jgi:hypothetical protein
LKHKIIGKLVWDIQLYLSENFKTKVIQNSGVFDDKEEHDRGLQFKLLGLSLPKYIWVVTLQINEQKVLHFIYDATGLSGSNIILQIFGYFPYFTSLFKNTLLRYNNISDTTFTYIFDHSIEKYINAVVE